MKQLTLLFALFLCMCVFVGASETEAEDGDLILPSLADIGFPNAPDADKPRVIKADEFEGPDTGASDVKRVGTVRGTARAFL